MPHNTSTRPLTPREHELLRLVCKGHATKEIAARLKISFKTVAAHRSALFQKGSVHNSIELFRWALKNGLVSLDD